VFGDGGDRFAADEVEAGAEGVLVVARWRDVALGTDHGAQGPGLCAGRQAGDLPADALERQAGGLREAADLGGAGQDRHRRLGEQALAVQGLPAVTVAT